MNYHSAKPDVTCSDLGNTFLSESPPALLHQGEAVGEEAAALHADVPVTLLQGEAGEGSRGEVWGKCTSLCLGNVKGERRVEDLESTFLYSPFTSFSL